MLIKEPFGVLRFNRNYETKELTVTHEGGYIIRCSVQFLGQADPNDIAALGDGRYIAGQFLLTPIFPLSVDELDQGIILFTISYRIE